LRVLMSNADSATNATTARAADGTIGRCMGRVDGTVFDKMQNSRKV